MAALEEATLCFVVQANRVLLIEKRRGLGEGWYNGPGGKLESGETPREAAIREVREEVGIEIVDPQKVGELTFLLDGDPRMYVHVFRTEDFEGDPHSSPEAHPEWVPVNDVPYDRMWDDDRLWLPLVLSGRSVRGTFAFEGGEPLDEAEFVDYELDVDVSFET